MLGINLLLFPTISAAPRSESWSKLPPQLLGAMFQVVALLAELEPHIDDAGFKARTTWFETLKTPEVAQKLAQDLKMLFQPSLLEKEKLPKLEFLSFSKAY